VNSSTSRSTRDRKLEHLTRRDFFHDIAESLRHTLPAPLQDFQAYTNMNLLKLSYGASRLHYEVWANARDNHIEVGLHFEDGPESTERLLRFFNARIVEIKHELGPSVELERWTNSWGHLFRLIPYQPLTDELAEEISDALTQMITVLQPLLIEAEPPRRTNSVLSRANS
jgi:hypothetical protein